MKKIIAVSLLVLLLSGCGVSLLQYPRVEAAPPVRIAPVRMDITLPSGADEVLETMVLTLSAKLKELSGGSIGLTSHHTGGVVAALQKGDPGLYLLTGEEVAQLDSRLGFTRMPFLFSDREAFSALLNSEGGVVRGAQATREKLGGEVLGVYYGGTNWFMGRGKLYDEVGFYNTVGVLSGLPGNACFSALGESTVTQGSSEELFSLFAGGKIKFCELRPTDKVSEEALAAVKNLELTNHRFESYWLILKAEEGAFEPVVKNILKEALSYTLEQQDHLRLDRESERMARLEEQLGLKLSEQEPYRQIWLSAKKYYRENWKTLGIPEDIWQAIVLNNLQ